MAYIAALLVLTCDSAPLTFVMLQLRLAGVRVAVRTLAGLPVRCDCCHLVHAAMGPAGWNRLLFRQQAKRQPQVAKCDFSACLFVLLRHLLLRSGVATGWVTPLSSCWSAMQ